MGFGSGSGSVETDGLAFADDEDVVVERVGVVVAAAEVFGARSARLEIVSPK